jgi:actin related protein 2/3 complex subunit 2
LEKPEALELKFADFDGVTYYIYTPDPENRNVLRFSMSMRGFQSQLAQYGAVDILRNEFAGMILETPMDGYDVSIDLDVKIIPAEQQGRPYIY